MPTDLTTLHRQYVADPSGSNLNTLLKGVQRFALVETRRYANLDSEDLTQQTMIAVWQGLATYTGESSITTWICAIIKNKAKDALRSRYASPELESMEIGDMDQITPSPDSRPTPPLTSLLSGEYTAAEREVMAALASGRDQIDVAADLGITHSALRSRLKRLKKKILRQSDTKVPVFSD